MARTTGPVLAIGGITLANRVILNDKPMDWRIPIATGLATGFFAMFEKAWPDGAITVAWVAFATVMFARVDPAVPAPAESLLEFTRGAKK